MSTYTIGEVAERSGFSASALRYYEGIGLVTPAHRTPAGYRVYDDGTLSRLGFIARAKQLGCTLDEITDLVGIWDGERCAPVQRRFHDLVTAKLAETEARLAGLRAFADQLHLAATRLAGPAIDGPCDEGCACLSIDAPLDPGLDPGVDTGVDPSGDPGVGPSVAPTSEAPIACTIADVDVPGRLALLERLRDQLERVDRSERGLVLRYRAGADVEADVRRFVADESRCCGFWAFAVDVTTDEVVLRWDGPPAAGELLGGLDRWFRGDDAAGPLAGLL